MEAIQSISLTPPVTRMPTTVADAQTLRLASVPQLPGLVGTFMGRDALTLVTSSLGLRTRDRVLLPIYTCQEVLRAFQKRVNVTFYDVEPDLTIDPDTIRNHLKAGGIRMVLITDYFGFLQPHRQEIKRICEAHGARLVEDCAHSLLTPCAGEVGDFAVYSLRKILPIPDGGALRVNQQEGAVNPHFHPRFYSNLLSLTATIKAALNIHTEKLSRARIASRASDVMTQAKGQEAPDKILPLSYFAHNGIAKMSLPEVIGKRRRDFLFWQEVCDKQSGLVPLFAELPSSVCPFGFPVKVKDRGALEASARRAGIHLGVHWRIEGEPGGECINSYGLSKQLLTLPVYPHLSERARQILTDIVARGRKHSG